MRTPAQSTGTSLVEVMISVGAMSILMGVLMLGSVSIQRSIRGSENFSTRYADQRRLIDYLARDLRRATAVLAGGAMGARTTLSTEPAILNDTTSLVLTIPGYYGSNVPADAQFSEALPVVQTGAGVDYGAKEAALAVEVSFCKMYIAREGCVCFVREEAGVKSVVVRDAKDLYVQVSLSPDGRDGRIRAWFVAPYSNARTLVATNDEVMLRNVPAGFQP